MSQPVEQRRADVVGQVGDDARRRAGGQRRHVDLQRVALDHLEPAGIGGGDLGQRRQAARVALDGDDPARTAGEQGAREAAGARADFHDRRTLQRARGAGDAAGQVEVEQEVLAEGLLRHQPVAGDDLAQRRQGVDGAQAVGFFCDRRAARAIDWIMLVGRALPVPASP